MQKYAVNQYHIEQILALIKSAEIAIPEIQRPFVWNKAQVRDLIDSIYKGYPVGYIITWQNPNVKLKDGSVSQGKKILIDGQQRITALTASMIGQEVVDKNYEKIKIRIAFNPIEEKFEVQNSAILKDKAWINDIAEVINGDIFEVVDEYKKLNPEAESSIIQKSFQNLLNIPKKQIGVIELSSDLDIETVTEIFIRINSKGVGLKQADFTMSKIASDEENGGNELRKLIDYFCHLSKTPHFAEHIEANDKDFVTSDFYQKIKWLKSENENLYNPEYSDVLRVAFTLQFNRGKLSDLVSLLSGRNFETRTYEKEIVSQSFDKLREGVLAYINETNFKRFLMIIKSAGFISPKLINSQYALNFAYIIYLKLRELGANPVDIEHYVKKWFVYSILTGRYSNSTETTFDIDIKNIKEKTLPVYLKEKEEADLSDSFWNVSLPQSMNTSSTSSPYFQVFLASQVVANDKGFLSEGITVADLIRLRGDIHHIFPKDYLQKNGYERTQYNQIANFVYMQVEKNIKVGNKSPKEYFSIISQQINDEKLEITGIKTMDDLVNNLAIHCIPENIMNLEADSYHQFLLERRKLMSLKIKDYYNSL